MVMVAGRQPAGSVGDKMLRNRSHNLDKFVHRLASGKDSASGKEHAATLLADHAKANPKLYKAIGVKLQRKLNVEQTAAFCNETSGLLGAAIRRHLTDCGIKLASKGDIHAYFKDSWEECETGKITVPDPKRRGV
eukprot:5990053-Pleurochrysis_carterae.AAC.1